MARFVVGVVFGVVIGVVAGAALDISASSPDCTSDNADAHHPATYSSHRKDVPPGNESCGYSARSGQFLAECSFAKSQVQDDQDVRNSALDRDDRVASHPVFGQQEVRTRPGELDSEYRGCSPGNSHPYLDDHAIASTCPSGQPVPPCADGDQSEQSRIQRTQQVIEAAAEAGVDAVALLGAVNTLEARGLDADPFVYLRSTGELGSPVLPPSAAASPPAPTSGVFDRLAQCEASGNWHANTGNGFSGGLQFTLGTWRAYGGVGSPAQASREAQIAVAERVLRGQGWAAWPACSRALGLR